MTDVAIAGLPAATSVLDSDLIIVEEIGNPNVTKRGTAAQMRANSLPLAGGTLTGGLTINSGGIAVTGASKFNNTVTLSAGGGWSSNNVGKQLLVTTPAGTSNPGIGITDTNGTNLWGVWNNAGVLNVSVMPAYSDGATGPTNIASFSSAGVAVLGTNTNNNAAAGYIGEVISASATVNASSGSATDIATVSLTAGDWDVHGVLSFTNAGATFTQIIGWISTTSASVPVFPNGGALTEAQASFTAAANQIAPVGFRRLSLSTTTTVYLGTLHSFSGTGPTSVGGFIEARRAR